jgi:hypothetical protein
MRASRWFVWPVAFVYNDRPSSPLGALEVSVSSSSQTPPTSFDGWLWPCAPQGWHQGQESYRRAYSNNGSFYSEVPWSCISRKEKVRNRRRKVVGRCYNEILWEEKNHEDKTSEGWKRGARERMAGPQVCGCLVELGGRGRQHRHLAKLRGRLEERGERGQPHGRLTDVHGGLAELERRGQ